MVTRLSGVTDEEAYKSTRLSDAMRRTLEDLANGGDGMRGIHGRSAHGGQTRVWVALRKRGFVDSNLDITDAGRKAIED